MANSEIQKDSFVKISYHTELETEAVISATTKEQAGLPTANHLLWVIQVSLSLRESVPVTFYLLSPWTLNDRETDASSSGICQYHLPEVATTIS